VLPWTRSCFVCGEANPRGLQAKSRIEDGKVVLDYTTRDTDLGWKHLVHGGLTITLMDEVMTWAAILDRRGACVAAKIVSRLRRPVPAGVCLRAEGRVTGRKSKLVLTEARILDPDGAVVATATGKYLPMPADKATLCEEDFVCGEGAVPLDRCQAFWESAGRRRGDTPANAAGTEGSP
jgi:uncharacterized protein (TIGR00369 family)